MEAILFGLLVLFIASFVTAMCYLTDANYKNSDLQLENTDLIHRNNKLDEMLEETRSIVITQNKIIAELRYNKEDQEFHPDK